MPGCWWTSCSYGTWANEGRKPTFAGILQLDFVRPGWYRGKRNAPLLAGLLVPGTCEWALPPLDQARIERIRGPNLYIVGVEETEEYRRLIKTHPQAWWCRLVAKQGQHIARRPQDNEGARAD